MTKIYYRKHESRKVLLDQHYCLHVQAMTAEALHDKGEIAEELAWRDIQIEQLLRAIELHKERREFPDTEDLRLYKVLERK